MPISLCRYRITLGYGASVIHAPPGRQQGLVEEEVGYKNCRDDTSKICQQAHDEKRDPDVIKNHGK